MPENPTDKDATWKSIQLRIGVIVAVIGLLTTIYNLIVKSPAASAATPKAPDMALTANFKISYVSMAGDIYASLSSEKPRSKNLLFMDFPVLENPQVNVLINGTHNPENAGMNLEYVTYLVLQNTGKGDARDIVVDLSSLHITDTLKISERDQGSDAYDRQIRAAASGGKKEIALPLQLSTGEGVLIPLFVSSWHPPGNDTETRWDIVSKNIFLPEVLHYKDASADSTQSFPIRKMRNPVTLGDGVQGRG